MKEVVWSKALIPQTFVLLMPTDTEEEEYLELLLKEYPKLMHPQISVFGLQWIVSEQWVLGCRCWVKKSKKFVLKSGLLYESYKNMYPPVN